MDKRVSKIINCTRENSQENNEGKRYCDVDVYKMGIKVQTSTTIIISEPLPIFEAARDLTCKANGTCDFNETIIIPFTLNKTNSWVPENSTGYFAFAPEQTCLRGTLRDCEDDRKDREGLSVGICGFELTTRGNNRSDPSDDVYAGTTTFVDVSDEEAEEIQELDDRRPLLTYEDAIKQLDEESGALESATMYGVVGYIVWSAVTGLLLSL